MSYELNHAREKFSLSLGSFQKGLDVEGANDSATRLHPEHGLFQTIHTLPQTASVSIQTS
jgi:hypothetical protein